MFTELVQVSYAENLVFCLSIQACTKHDCSAWGLGKARAPRIMQVGRDVRRFLVQSAAQGTICFEVLWGCSGLYPVRSSKPPRMELPQPCWVTSLSAWLFSQEKGSSLYPLWVSLTSVYLDRKKLQQLNEMEDIYPGPWVKSSLQGTVIHTVRSLWAPYHRPPNRCKMRSREPVSYLQIQFVLQYSLPGLGGRERREENGTLHTLEQSLVVNGTFLFVIRDQVRTKWMLAPFLNSSSILPFTHISFHALNSLNMLPDNSKPEGRTEGTLQSLSLKG